MVETTIICSRPQYISTGFIEGGGDYEYRVLKNSVLRRAAEGLDAAEVSELFVGPTVLALSYGDPIGLAKILTDFSKQHEVFELLPRASHP